MKVGDIVRYEDKLWRVETHYKSARLCKIRSWADDVEEVPDDHDNTEMWGDTGLTVHANPSDDWPFVAAPHRSGDGPIREVLSGGVPLTPLEDWMPSSRLRQGGSLFINPSVGLRRGDMVIAVHKHGHKSRIDITGSFGTIKDRKAGRLQARPRRANRGQALLNNDPFEGGEV